MIIIPLLFGIGLRIGKHFQQDRSRGWFVQQNIKGGQKEAFEFIDHLQIFSLLANVADVKSLVIHPATTPHSQLSNKELEAQHIYPSTIRLSIGTEHIDDLIADIKQALEKI